VLETQVIDLIQQGIRKEIPLLIEILVWFLLRIQLKGIFL